MDRGSREGLEGVLLVLTELKRVNVARQKWDRTFAHPGYTRMVHYQEGGNGLLIVIYISICTDF